MTSFKNKMPVIKTIWWSRRRGITNCFVTNPHLFFFAGPFSAGWSVCCVVAFWVRLGTVCKRVADWAKTVPMADGNMREVTAPFWVDLSLLVDEVEGCLRRSARVCLSFSSPHPYRSLFLCKQWGSLGDGCLEKEYGWFYLGGCVWYCWYRLFHLIQATYTALFILVEEGWRWRCHCYKCVAGN